MDPVTVGIREFKAQLSHYLDRASNGERITVTAHGKPKVVIVGLLRDPVIEQGIAEGWIREPERPPTIDRSRKKYRPIRPTAELFEEDREDRL